MASPPILPGAIALFQAGRIDLDGLCRLHAAWGASGMDPDADPEALAASMDLLAPPDDVRHKLSALWRERGVTPQVSLAHEAPAPSAGEAGDAGFAHGGMLGSGGTGYVINGTDRCLRRAVAIKALWPQAVADDLMLQAFFEEAIITGGLEHPNIVPIYEIGVSPTLGPFYAMKRVPGESLAAVLERLKAGDTVTAERWSRFALVGVLVEVCQAVAYAHARGVVHCDIKPGNVVVGDFGEVCILDWGIARAIGQPRQASDQLWSGSPSYMAPEQAQGEASAIDPRTDIWALGVLLYEVLTLTRPFGDGDVGTLWRMLNQPVELPSVRAPGRAIPPELDEACARALQKDRADRFPSVEALIGVLNGWMAGTRARLQRDAVAAEAAAGVQAALDRVPELGSAAGRLGVCEEAGGDLLGALTLAPDHRGLQELAAALYWAVFTGIYPGQSPPGPEERSRALALLNRLSQTALHAIVQRGPAGVAAPDDCDDAWLQLVMDFCGAPGAAGETAVPGSMTPLVRRVAFLKTVRLFQGMGGSDLLPIADRLGEATFPAGSWLFKRGDRPDFIYIVVEGTVEIHVEGVVLASLESGVAFGEVAAFDGRARTAGAWAATPTRCYTLRGADVFELAQRHASIGLQVVWWMTRMVRKTTAREAELRKAFAGLQAQLEGA